MGSMLDLKAPPELLEMIDKVMYKEGWHFQHFCVKGTDYLRISILCEDSTGKYQREVESLTWLHQERPFGIDNQDYTRLISYDPQPFGVTHTMQIPYQDYFVGDIHQMRRWLMDRVIDIETHEACEFFKLPAEAPGAYYVPFFPHDKSHGVYKVVDKTPSHDKQGV